jgi:cell pole-organizing protein PopZ
MNKPATKEPSMDEILSSIRQIIADDDATPPAPPARPPVAAAAPKPAAAPPAAFRPEPANEPLTLSAAQIVKPASEPEAPPADFSAMLAGLDDAEPEVSEAMEAMLADEPQLVDPEDIAFETEPEPEPAPAPVAVAPPPVVRAVPPPVAEPAPRPTEPPRAAPPRPAASVAQAAPLPDPTLSSDMAEELLEPTTQAAIQGSMARLNSMAGMGIGGQTVEGMMRDLLRPMLKDWLDENLPALVERMVEKEIARISRGVK